MSERELTPPPPSVGFKPKGFGRVPRWDEQKQDRIVINDKYLKKMSEQRVKDEERKEIEDRKKLHGTFGTGPQFTLFNTGSGKPGPGDYNPEKLPVRVSCNVKLGHTMTVKGGTGAEGANVAGFENQKELIGKALIGSTGIGNVDQEMKKYRRNIDTRIREAGEDGDGDGDGNLELEGEKNRNGNGEEKLTEEELCRRLFSGSRTPKF